MPALLLVSESARSRCERRPWPQAVILTSVYFLKHLPADNWEREESHQSAR